MEIVWAEEAYLAWQETVDYIIQQCGVNAGIEFYKNTESWQDALITFPLMGKEEPLLANRLHAYRSLTISRLNKLIYYIEGDIINIVDFWDTRREPGAQAKRIE